LDYAWPDPGVGTEFDGWMTHGTREAFQDDRTRDRRLQIRGWRVLHYTAEDVACRPEEVLAEIGAAVSVKKSAGQPF
jgi:very-short-patch-repair endonuclease